MRALRWLIGQFEKPWAARIIILIALVLTLPAVVSPYFIDEYIQEGKWKAWHDDIPRAGKQHILNDYFNFADGSLNPVEREKLGVWWMAPDLKLSFWRPMAAATHMVDHVLWPRNTVAIHLHGLLWFLGLLVAIHFLFRRFLPLGIANLALALYAWDDARGMVLSWIANRHALIAGFLGAWVLITHDKWRRDAWRPGSWLAPALFGLGLLSSELAVSTAAFLFAYALWVDQGSLRHRLARLLPFFLVAVAWQAAYLIGGYGAQATAGYVSPLTEPFAYGIKVLERSPIYLMGQLTPVESMFYGISPSKAKAAIFLFALATLAIVVRIAWPRLSGQPQSRFWITGAALSLPVICTSATWDRNLVFVGLGVSPALAMVIAALAKEPSSPRWPRVVVVALGLFNLGLAPLLLPVKSMTMLGLSHVFPSPDASIPRDPAIVQKTLVLPSVMFEAPLWYTWVMRDGEGIPRPDKARILTAGFGPVTVTRLDELTLRLRSADGFFTSDSSKLFRSDARPYRRGERVTLSNLTATITELTDDGRPRMVEFRFASQLESPEWLWMRSVPTGLAPWSPPRVGETVTLPAGN